MLEKLGELCRKFQDRFSPYGPALTGGARNRLVNSGDLTGEKRRRDPLEGIGQETVEGFRAFNEKLRS